MASTGRTGGGDAFTNLGRTYLLFTLAFFACVGGFWMVERWGLPTVYIGYAYLLLMIMVYAVSGIIAREADARAYYLAGQQVPAYVSGMATSADWMSAASFLGMAGALFLLGYDGLAFVLGWTGGYVLVAVLIAPFLRKLGAYTVPDFFGERYEGSLPRLLAVIVLITCSFTYVVAQIYGTGLIAQRFLGIDFDLAIYIGLFCILLCAGLGGMRADTWTQVAQFIVLVVAYLAPVIILSVQRYGLPVPQIAYGQAIADIATLEQAMVRDGLAAAAKLKPHSQPFQTYSPLNYFGLILCLMVGTASLPHVLMRYFATPSVRDARISVAWSLLFISVLYLTAPAYAAFAKLEVYGLIAKATPLADLPAWMFTYGKLGLVKICGADAVSVEAVAAACGRIAGHPGVLRHQDLALDTDAIVLVTPEMAGLPFAIVGLVAAGGLAAAISTAEGLLLAIANALSHDVYFKMIDKRAPTSQRLMVSRIVLVAVAVLAAWVATTRPANLLTLVAWAFSLAAAGIFPALVLGVWWKRANKWGCIAGMIVGFGLCLTYLLVTRYFPGFGVGYLGMAALLDPATGHPLVDLATAMRAPGAMDSWVAPSHPLASKVGWFDISNLASALLALPAGIATLIVVSLATPRPSQRMYDIIDRIRRPRS